MAKRLIGTGITNSQGVAIMNKDPEGNPITGYTGVGAGQLQIIAETGTLQSETENLLDAIVLETELTTNKTWNTALNDTDFYLEFTVHPTLAEDSIARIQIGTTTNYLFIGDLFSNASCGIQWNYNGTTSNFYGKVISDNEDTTITVTRKGTNITLTIGETSYNITNMPIICTNLINATITNNKIKNFKIYPI